MEKEKLLELRKKLKKKKPFFIRKDSFKKSRLGKRRKKKQKWRRPRGRHSKLREKRKSYMSQPSIGWSSPKAVRGLINEFKPKLIHNAQELEKLEKDEIAIIGTIGKKKKIEIAEKAFEKNIKILNLNVKKFLEKVKIEKEKKLEAKKEEIKKEEEKKQKIEKKEDTKEKKEEKSEEEKLEEEKKEKEKMLHDISTMKKKPKIVQSQPYKEKKEMRRMALEK